MRLVVQFSSPEMGKAGPWQSGLSNRGAKLKSSSASNGEAAQRLIDELKGEDFMTGGEFGPKLWHNSTSESFQCEVFRQPARVGEWIHRWWEAFRKSPRPRPHKKNPPR